VCHQPNKVPVLLSNIINYTNIIIYYNTATTYVLFTDMYYVLLSNYHMYYTKFKYSTLTLNVQS